MSTRNSTVKVAGAVASLALAASMVTASPAHAATVSVERIAGADRYATSAQVSTKNFEPGVGTLFVASGEDYPDALAAGAVAGQKKAPLLLVKKGEIPGAVSAEIDRLKPQSIVIVGGEGAVSDDVRSQLADKSASVKRVAGVNRYETASLLSNQNFGIDTPFAFVASGASFPDALSASSAGALAGGPVLLTPRVGLPASTGVELERLDPRHILVVGGSSAIADSTAREAYEYRVQDAGRFAGADRYGTAAAVLRAVLPTTKDTVFIASGANYPDALAGVSAAAVHGAPVFIVPANGVSTQICTEVRRVQPKKIVVLGGSGAVSDASVNAVVDCAGQSPLIQEATGGTKAITEAPGGPTAPAPTPTPTVPVPGGDTPPAVGTVTCASFQTQAQAQAYYDYWLERGYADRFGLAADGSGLACGHLQFQ